MIIFLDNSNDLTGQAFLTPELQMSKPGLENWISGHLGFRLRSASFQSLDSTPPTLSRVSKARSLGWQGQGRTDLQTIEPMAWGRMEKSQTGNSAQKSIWRVQAGVKRGPSKNKAWGGGGAQSWVRGCLHRNQPHSTYSDVYPGQGELCSTYLFLLINRYVFVAAKQRESTMCTSMRGIKPTL